MTSSQGVPSKRAVVEPPGEFIPLATINRVRGLSGEVVVTVHADDPARIGSLASLFIDETDGPPREVLLEGVKKLGTRMVIKLAGFNSPEEARALVGRQLLIPKAASTPAPKGRYYAWQLEGMEARLSDGSILGRVREVMSQGPQSLLIVEGPRGEIMIPLVQAICVKIDEENGCITLDPPEGLIELNQVGGVAAKPRATE